MNQSVLTGAFCLLGGLAGLGMAAVWKSPAASPQAPPSPWQQVPVASFSAATAGVADLRALLRELPAPDPSTALGRQAAWLERLKKADTVEMKAMLEEARRNADPYERRLFREMVFVKWIQDNAEEAYAYSKVYDEGRVEAQFVFYWARANPDQAWETFSREGSTQYQFWMMGVVAEEDPGRYLEMMSDPARARVMENSGIYEAVLRDGKRNTQADAEKALKTANPKQGESLLQATCLLWARRDPEAAMKWARELKDPGQQRAAVCGALREMAARDPKAAAAEIDRLDGTWPVSLVNEVAAGLAKQGLEQVTPYLESFSAKARSGVLLDGIIPVMDRLDTGTVLPLLEKYWDPKAEVDKGESPLGALSKWVPDDPSKEWNALAGFPDSTAKSELARVLAPQLARTNPAAALAAAEQSEDPALRNILGRELANGSIQKGDEAGFLKSLSLLEGQTFVKAVYDMTRELSENAPDMGKAIEFAGRQTGQARTNATEQTAWLWSYRDPAAALTWLVEGGEPMTPGFQKNLLSRWAKDDSYAASEWLDSLPAGSSRDAYTTGLVSSVVTAEPDSAFAWSQTMSDPAARLKWSQWTVQEWARRDPAAAWQAVEGAGVDEATRTALRSALTVKTKASK